MTPKSFMLKMRARRKAMKGKKEFKQAAFAYMGLKTVIFVLTYIFLTCKGCEYNQFIRQGIHLFLFSHFIYAGMRITSGFIGTICFVRGTAFVINFFFKTSFWLTLPYTGTTLTLLREEGLYNWVFLVNGLLTISISLMIFRAIRARYRKSVPVQENAESAITSHC